MGDPVDDALQMAKAGALVATVAVPVAVACAVILRLRGQRVCPRWSLPCVVWPGPVILGLFLTYRVAYPLFMVALDTAGFFSAVYPSGFPTPAELDPSEAVQVVTHLKMMWAGLGFIPALLLAALMVRITLLSFGWPRSKWRDALRGVALATFVWLTFGAAAYALNLTLQLLLQELGRPVAEHPLSKLGASGDGMGGVLFVLSACVAAPVLEEFLFRGLLVSWTGGRWYRPWVLLLFAGVSVAESGNVEPAAIGFVVALGVGLYLIQQFGKRVWRFPRRTTVAVWSSSALFAVAHSSVWPTPIPLFVLALGLGYLTARTRSWLPAAVAHGLFNLVSTMFVFSRG